MATESSKPFPPLGKITIRVDRIYGRLVVYPVCERAKLIAEIAGTKLITHQALCLVERLGFEITLAEGSANALNAELNEALGKVAA